MTQITKYRLLNDNGSWIETLSLSEAEFHGNYEIIIEEVVEPKDVPLEVALWKLRFILSQMQLEQSVTNAIDELPEPQKTAANYIWNFGTAVDRYSPTVSMIKEVLNINDNQVDDIFIEANKVTL